MAYIGRQIATAILGELKEFTDVANDAYVDGDFLIYNSSSGAWLTTSVSIDSLNNVDISGLATNNILAYNGSNFVPTASPTLTTVTATTFTDGTASITSGAITGATTATFSSNVSVGGNLDVTGNITLGGNIDIGDAATDTVTFSADVDSNFIPDASDTYDLGSATQAWRDLYLSEAITFKGATTENEIVVPTNLADALSVKDSAGDLIVIDTTTGNQAITITPPVTLTGAPTVAGAMTINNTLAVSNNVSLTADADLTITNSGSTNIFTVDGATGNTAIGGTLNLTNNFDINSNFAVTAGSGNTTIGGTLSVTNNVDVNSNFSVVAASGNTTVGGTFDVTGATNINNTTASTSSTTGALIVDGGAGIAGALNIGGATTVTGLTSADGGIDVNGSNFTVATTGNTLVGGTFDVTGATNINNTTASTSTTSGALIVDGGAGIAGALHIGGTLNVTSNVDVNSNFTVVAASGNTTVGGTFDVTGVTNINNTTQSTSATSGGVIIDGGVGIAKNLNVGGDLAVTGALSVANLTVSGTTTTVNSTVVTIDDPIFTIGGDTAPSSDDNKDRGIEFRYHTGSAAKVGFFGYDDSLGKFTFIADATNSSEVFSGTVGDLQVGGINSAGHFIPNADNTYDLGQTSTGNAWRHLFLKSNIEFTGASGANKIQIADNQADALTIEDIAGTPNEFLTFTTTTGAVKLVVKQATEFDSTIDVTGVANFNATTTSSSNTTGAVVIDGGLGLAENLNMGGNADIDGNLVIGGTTTLGNATGDTITINGNMTPGQANGRVFVTSSTASHPEFIVQNTADDATSPTLIICNERANPADNDVGGIIEFRSLDDGDNIETIGKITATMLDVTDGTEDGKLVFATMKAGTQTDTLTLSSGEMQVAGAMTAGASAFTISATGATQINNSLTLESNNNFTFNNGSSSQVFQIVGSSGATTIAGATTINNAVTFESDNNFTLNNSSSNQVFLVDMSSGATTIGGATTINNTLAVSNNVNLSTSANFTMKDSAGTPATVFNVAGATGNTTIAGTMTVSGNVVTDSAANFTMKDNAGSPATVFNVVGSTGATTIAGPTIVNNTMNVNNAVTFKDNSSNSFNIKNSSNTTIFDVTMATGATTISGATTINNTFATNNNVTFTDSSSNNFNIDNSSNTTVFDVDMSTGATIISGATTINNTMAVNNNVTFTDSSSNNFKIENSSNTAVFNVAMSTGAVTIEGDTNINNTLTLVDASSDKFTIKNSSNNNTFNVDMSTGATTIEGDTTINNTLVLVDASSDSFTIKNTSNANTFNIDMSTGNTTIEGATTINNAVTFESNNNFTINNNSSNQVFQIDMSTGDTTIEGDVVFNDNRTQIKNSSNTTLFDIDIANVAVNIDMATTISNNVTFDNDITFNIDNSSSVNVFKVLGASGNTTIGGTLDVTGIVNLNNTTQSTSNTTGALIVDGGVGIAKVLNVGGNADVDGNLTVGGNLIVNGTTTQMDITTMNISDALIKVGDGNTGTAVDLGFVFTRGDGSSEDTNNVSFFYDESIDTFVFATTNTEDGTTNGNITINGYEDIMAGGMELYSSVATDAAGPDIKLHRDSASPADADYMGRILFTGNSDTGVERNYAKITGKILDASNGTEDGIIEFANMKAGSQTITARLRSDSLQLLNGTNLNVAGTAEVTGETTLSSVIVSDITDNRIVIGGTSGALEDDANLTFDGSILTVGTTAAIKIPVGTTGQRPTAAQGQIRFNTTDTTFEGYDGTAWGSLGGIKDVDADTYISAEDAAGDDNDELDFYTAGTLRATIDSSGDLKFGASVNKFTVAHSSGNTAIAGTLDVTSNMTVTGNTTLNGDTDIGNATTDTVTVTGQIDSDIIPSTNDARNLGSATQQWDTVFTNNIHMHNAYHSHAATATSSSTSQFVLDSWSASTYRSAEYFILAQDTDNSTYHTEKLLVLHDGTNTYMTSYGTLITNASEFTVSSDVNGGNVRLLITPAGADTMSFRFIAQKHLI